MAAVCTGVCLDETRLSDIPVLGADGNLTFEQRAGPGRREDVGMLETNGAQQAVERGRRDAQQS